MRGSDILALQAAAGWGSGIAPALRWFKAKDIEYSQWTDDFVNGEFAAAFRADLTRKGLIKFVDEANDCDDFAFAAFNFAREDEAIRGKRLATVAFGVMEYYKTTDMLPKSHWANFFVARGNLTTWEPQVFTNMPLSDAEVAAVRFTLV